MLEGIHIQNFRCFEDFQLEGFGQVNLIGGLNNSGKTVLLEGIFLGDLEMPTNISHLKNLRHNYGYKWSECTSTTMWNDLFFNKKTEKTIHVSHNWEGNLSNLVIKQEEDRFQQKVSLNLKSTFNTLPYLEANIFAVEGKNQPELEIIDLMDTNTFSKQILFLSIREEAEPSELAKSYSQLELDGKEHYIVQAIRLIDSTISSIKIIAVGEPNLYASSQNGPLIPIEFFGDAIRKMLHIIFAILETENGILLIDEIENGIHYTSQPKLWEMIFKLAQEFNVQVFATTHSKEMADAFNKVALEQEENIKARYIEMARHYKTNKIIGTVIPPNILQHKIDNNQAFRGE